MRFGTVLLLVLLGLVQSQLWFGKGGMPKKLELQARLAEQQQKNASSRVRNARLVAEVSDLKEGLEMVEEKARFELGMVKPDEVLVQISDAKPR